VTKGDTARDRHFHLHHRGHHHHQLHHHYRPSTSPLPLPPLTPPTLPTSPTAATNAHHKCNDIPRQRTTPNTPLSPTRASLVPQAKQRRCPPHNYALSYPRREPCKASTAALPPPLPWPPSMQHEPMHQRPASMTSQHPLAAANAPTLPPIPSYKGISTLIITMAYQYAGVYSGILVRKYYNYSGILVRWS
jgi:hypothetical protein